MTNKLEDVLTGNEEVDVTLKKTYALGYTDASNDIIDIVEKCIEQALGSKTMTGNLIMFLVLDDIDRICNDVYKEYLGDD